jgi:hypothetical protein
MVCFPLRLSLLTGSRHIWLTFAVAPLFRQASVTVLACARPDR